MKEFDLEGHEYIALNKLLKLLGFADTGGEANQQVENGEVHVNGNLESQKRKKLRSGDNVTFRGSTILIR